MVKSLNVWMLGQSVFKLGFNQLLHTSFFGSVFSLILLLPFVAEAEDKLLLTHITILGLDRTDRQVILDELRFDENQRVSQKQIEQGVQNIKNTNLFTNVDYQLREGAQGQTLHIDLEERWTTIPIFKLSSGGGVNQLIAGVYDPNIFGKYIEAGAQYERLGDTDSGVVWLKKPRLWGSDYGIDIQYWQTSRIRTKYVLDAEDPIEKTGFLHQRDKFYLALTKTFSPSMKADAFYEYNDDAFSDDLLSDDIKNLLAIEGLPPATTYHFLGVGLDLGTLNFDDHLVDGNVLESVFSVGLSSAAAFEHFVQLDLNYRYYKTIWDGATFAQRLMFGTTTTDVLQYWYYLGGLDRIRGFADNRFAGRHFWLSNTELRYPVYEHDWAVLQSTAFVDMATATESFKGLFGVEAASVGLGLRITLPKVYRFVFRLDFAQPVLKNDDMNFSFGVQQFF